MLKSFLLLCCTVPLAGCYYMQAASGQWEVMRKRVPVEDVITDEATPAPLAERLRLVAEARDFSIDVLGLPDNQSYRSYSDLDRDFVVWNVVAVPEFSLQPKKSCFPVAGCVSYRGYFSKSAAANAARKLNRQGYDTYVGGVSAYSTLGKFSDPVLNTMMRYDDVQLVAVLFHELAHQLLYIKGDSGFNESFATAVEEFGVEAWLESRGEIDDFDRYRQRREMRQGLMILVASARNDLRRIFESSMNAEKKRALKADRLQAFSTEYRKSLEEAGRGSGEIGEMNNATLVAMTLYEGRLPAFRALRDQCRRNIECFYSLARELADLSRDDRDRRLDELGEKLR